MKQAIHNSSLNFFIKVFLKSIFFFCLIFCVVFLLSLSFPCHSLASENTSGLQDFYIQQGDIERFYKVYVPSSYDSRIPMPLVLAFHGGAGSAEGSVSYFQLNDKADQEGFFVVYPQGLGRSLAGKTFGVWNAGRCCGKNSDKVDDVDFIKRVIEKVKKDFIIDAKRIYATGMSNGAMMSYALACEMSDTIAAIAPVGAHDVELNCNPSRAVPILHIHGKQDPCAPYAGGSCGGCSTNFLRSLIGLPPTEKSLWQCSSVEDYLEKWRIRNECSAQTEVIYQQGDAVCRQYKDCAHQADVVLCTVDNMGHVWPGRETYGIKACHNRPNGIICNKWKNIVGPLNSDLKANDLIWEFFKAHPLP